MDDGCAQIDPADTEVVDEVDEHDRVRHHDADEHKQTDHRRQPQRGVGDERERNRTGGRERNRDQQDQRLQQRLERGDHDDEDDEDRREHRQSQLGERLVLLLSGTTSVDGHRIGQVHLVECGLHLGRDCTEVVALWSHGHGGRALRIRVADGRSGLDLLDVGDLIELDEARLRSHGSTRIRIACWRTGATCSSGCTCVARTSGSTGSSCSTGRAGVT